VKIKLKINDVIMLKQDPFYGIACSDPMPGAGDLFLIVETSGMNFIGVHGEKKIAYMTIPMLKCKHAHKYIEKIGEL
jgi:hypothetical protein